MVLIISASVDIVEFEAYANAFPCVHAELCSEMILAIGTVSGCVVCKICEWRQCVGELELLNRCDEEVVWLGENELFCLRTVYENAVDAWRAKVAGGVVFTP